jgi:hypothetical protein
LGKEKEETMKKCKYEAGYIGKKDRMRDEAKKLLKGDTDLDIKGYFLSGHAPQYLKKRTFKKGGHVVPRNKAARGSELHISQPIKEKKTNQFLNDNRKDGYFPRKAEKMKKGGKVSNKMRVIVPGSHPMIGTEKKSLKLSGGKKAKNDNKVKAKQSQPYDASQGQYMRRGGKIHKHRG